VALSGLRRLLSPPVFEDEAVTHQALVLHVILWALVAVPPLYVGMTALVAPGHTGRALVEGGFGEAANVALLWLLRRGKVAIAAGLQVVAFFSFFTVLAALGNGVRSPAYMLGYATTIAVAGALLGGRGAFAATAAAVIAGGLFVARGAPAREYDPDFDLFVLGVSVILFPVSALVQNLASRAVRQALGRARASETGYRELVAELEAKNAELESFTYTVSHDLKSPLFTLRGFLGYMERDVAAGNHERLRADIARITDAADKMRRLLDDLLEISRIGRFVNPPQDVAFDVIAREAVELVRGGLDSRGVAVRIAAGLPVVRGDRSRLVQLVQNLVDNASKFMGGQPQPQIDIGLRAGGRLSTFYVRDNGVGIAPRHQERVFRLFEKLDPGSDGTGVGLALVRRIVELHGGRVWVESAGDGSGATFCFTLPVRGESN
jgi:signal transduction histidine kinase